MNVFTFSGNLGADCRTNNSGGTAVANFTVAVKSGYGEKEQTLWVDCALWGKRAEGKLLDYLKKGQKVMVSGELGSREHEGKTYLACRVNDITLAGDKASGGNPSNHQQAPAQNNATPTPNTAPTGGQDFDDDIPFAPIGKQYRGILNCM